MFVTSLLFTFEKLKGACDNHFRWYIVEDVEENCVSRRSLFIEVIFCTCSWLETGMFLFLLLSFLFKDYKPNARLCHVRKFTTKRTDWLWYQLVIFNKSSTNIQCSSIQHSMTWVGFEMQYNHRMYHHAGRTIPDSCPGCLYNNCCRN